VVQSESALLQVRDLKKYFPVQRGALRRTSAWVKAVDGIDLDVEEGETLGLVGESGCGKTTAGRTILRLLKPTSGEILFRSKSQGGGEWIDVSTAPRRMLKALRAEMQLIFQDPYSSLNPRLSVGSIVGEPYLVQGELTRSERDARVKDLLVAVGLKPDHMKRYPHEFSGGQRQRIGIARALALDPQFIVCDEPVSALDVSIQAQVLNLLESLQQDFSLTYLFIAHDLSVVKHISDRIAVMYLGRIVELSSAAELFSEPKHPYTEALMSAVPVPDPRFEAERILLEGDVPSPIDPPEGCAFHPRCSYADPICRQETPVQRDLGDGRSVACHFADTLRLQPIQQEERSTNLSNH